MEPYKKIRQLPFFIECDFQYECVFFKKHFDQHLQECHAETVLYIE